MKKLLLLAGLMSLSFLVIAQQEKGASTEVDTSWKKGGFININFTQVSLNQWAQGGENSLALAGTLNLFSNYEKDQTTWSNALDLAYTVLKSGSIPLRKSDDRIDLASKYSRLLKGKWYWSVLL